MNLHRNVKLGLIRSLPLFADCTAREVAAVAAIADEIVLPAGKLLARENAVGREFVVIASGTATVQRGDEVTAQLRSGDFFGEIALITGDLRMASVVATTDVDALVIEGHAFLRLLETTPEIRVKVERAVAERLAAAS